MQGRGTICAMGGPGLIEGVFHYLALSPRSTRRAGLSVPCEQGCVLAPPFGLSCPFALASLWAGLRGRPFLSVIPMIIVCPIHPQVSLEIGAVALTTAGLSAKIFRTRSPSSAKAGRPKQLVKALHFVGMSSLPSEAKNGWHQRPEVRGSD
jgi:hypothetical protein